MRSGDLCRFKRYPGAPVTVVEHYRCDEHPDGTETDHNGNIVKRAPLGALWGFNRDGVGRVGDNMGRA